MELKILKFSYKLFFNVTYVPCIILQYVYEPTRCTNFLWLDFILYYMLYMFLVHHQEQLL